MYEGLARHLTFANVVSVIALFIALGGVGAYATHPGGTNTIDTNDVIDGTLKARDLENFAVNKNKIGPDAVSNTKVQNNSLKGDDIDEASLGAVTSSLLGGLGRQGLRQNGNTGPGTCDPESTTFINCDMVATLDLPRPARVLVIGSVRAGIEIGGGVTQGYGYCQLGTTAGPIPGSTKFVTVEKTGSSLPHEHVSIAGVTGVFPAGTQHGFGIDCNELLSTSGTGIEYGDAMVTAVALSDG